MDQSWADEQAGAAYRLRLQPGGQRRAGAQGLLGIDHSRGCANALTGRQQQIRAGQTGDALNVTLDARHGLA